jgi:peroxiredoxin
MVASLLLIGCVLTPGQTAERADWLLTPRLSRAQEFAYSGTFAEESTGGSVLFNRSFRVECRFLVLDSNAKGSEAAFLTVLKARELLGDKRAAKTDALPCSARLEFVMIDPQGRLSSPSKASLALPLDGPPTLECGAVMEMPRRRIGVDFSWEASEAGQPGRAWKVIGTELIDGVRCVRLLGSQQSNDWDQPRADHTAWRRRDTVWLDPVVGVAHRVERLIERRDPARQEPTYKSVLRYDLESRMQYPRQLFEDRQNEIRQAHHFGESLKPVLPNPAKHEPEIDALLAKIKNHLDHEPPTPYREAVLHIKRRAEAAKRGDTAPQSLVEDTLPTAVAAPGRPAPDFMAPDFAGKEPARLKKWLGQPIVMVFYTPTSKSARELLRFAQHLHEDLHPQINVLGMAVSDDVEQVRSQQQSLQLRFALLNGRGLKQTYAVETTPKFIVIDGKGIVRAAFTGWGQETAADVREEVKKWIPKEK